MSFEERIIENTRAIVINSGMIYTPDYDRRLRRRAIASQYIHYVLPDVRLLSLVLAIDSYEGNPVQVFVLFEVRPCPEFWRRMLLGQAGREAFDALRLCGDTTGSPVVVVDPDPWYDKVRSIKRLVGIDTGCNILSVGKSGGAQVLIPVLEQALNERLGGTPYLDMTTVRDLAECVIPAVDTDDGGDRRHISINR